MKRFPYPFCSLLYTHEDIWRRLQSAPTNIARYYLVSTVDNTYIGSPGWGLYTVAQMMDINNTLSKVLSVQKRARLTVDFNRTKIESVPFNDLLGPSSGVGGREGITTLRITS